MYMNTTRIKFEVGTTGCVGLYLNNDALTEERTRKGQNASYGIHVVLTAEEMLYAAQCARGESTMCPWFDDIGYLIRFGPTQVRILHKDGGASRRIYGTGEMEYHYSDDGKMYERWTGDWESGTLIQEHYFVFSVHEIAYMMELAARQAMRFKTDADENRRAANDWTVPSWKRTKFDHDIQHRRWSHEFQPETLARWKREYAPYIRYEFNGDALSGYKAALRDPRVFVPKNGIDLRDLFRSLGNLARNSSNGNLVTISVNPEHNGDAPLSFNWVIWAWPEREKSYRSSDYYKTPAGHKVMNGGIIAHARHAKDRAEADELGLDWPDDADDKYYSRPITGYSYSSHT